MIKEFKKGKWLLTHTRYVNDMGYEVDDFNLLDTEERINRPFLGKIKTAHASVSSVCRNKIPYNYTNDDYEQMLDEQVSKIK